MRFKRGQKGHDTRQFEGGALKGKFLPRGAHAPGAPLVLPPMSCSVLSAIASIASCVSAENYHNEEQSRHYRILVDMFMR